MLTPELIFEIKLKLPGLDGDLDGVYWGEAFKTALRDASYDNPILSVEKSVIKYMCQLGGLH